MTRRAPWLTRAVGATTLVLAITVLIGHVLAVPALVQVREGLVPVQPNSAIAFAAVGASLLLGSVGARWPAVVFGSVAAAIGALTLVEYTLVVDLRIDDIWPAAFPRVQTVYPARMAPNTAVAHTVLGVAAALLGWGEPQLRRWGSLLGATALVLGAEGIAVHAIAGDPYALGWGDLARMAVPTAVAFMVLGTLVLWRTGPVREHWKPLRVQLIGVVLVLGVWHAQLGQRGSWVRDVVEQTADSTAVVVRDEVGARVLALRSMADQWEDPQVSPTAEWREDALRYLGEYPSFEAFVWVDAEGVARWSLAPGWERARAVEAATSVDWPDGFRDAVALNAGESARLALAVPVLIDSRSHGHMVGIVNGRVFARDVLVEEHVSGFMVELALEDQVVGRMGSPEAFVSHVASRAFYTSGSIWTVSLTPGLDWLAPVRSGLPEVVLVMGLGLCLVLAHVVRLTDETRERSRSLEVANMALHDEIAAHAKARAALSDSHAELEHRVERRTNELQRSNADLTRSNRELQHFASVASHDLKEPLQTIGLYCQMLARQVQDPEEKRYLNAMWEGVKRMSALIDDLLDYARAGGESPIRESVELDSVVDEVLATLGGRLQQSEAEVVRGELPAVLGDRRRLVQLLQNLVVNALKFRGEERPRIDVGVRTRDAKGLVEVYVRDNGIGIEPEHAERVFEMFHRVQRADVAGTGLGLAICRKIVESHGGRIWVESIPGRGATFVFTLPVAERAMAGQTTPEAIQPPPRLQ